MERCDCKTGGPCLKKRGELPVNQTCVEKKTHKVVSSIYNARCSLNGLECVVNCTVCDGHPIPKSSKLEPLHGSQNCLYSLLENQLAVLYRNQEKIYALLHQIARK